MPTLFIYYNMRKTDSKRISILKKKGMYYDLSFTKMNEVKVLWNQIVLEILSVYAIDLVHNSLTWKESLEKFMSTNNQDDRFSLPKNELNFGSGKQNMELWTHI